jgi:hypothetical protein
VNILAGIGLPESLARKSLRKAEATDGSADVTTTLLAAIIIVAGTIANILMTVIMGMGMAMAMAGGTMIIARMTAAMPHLQLSRSYNEIHGWRRPRQSISNTCPGALSVSCRHPNRNSFRSSSRACAQKWIIRCALQITMLLKKTHAQAGRVGKERTVIIIWTTVMMTVVVVVAATAAKI